MFSPPFVQGGDTHSLRERGWGSQFRRGDRHCGTLGIYLYMHFVFTSMGEGHYTQIICIYAVLRIRIRDPGLGAFLTPESKTSKILRLTCTGSGFGSDHSVKSSRIRICNMQFVATLNPYVTLNYDFALIPNSSQCLSIDNIGNEPISNWTTIDTDFVTLKIWRKLKKSIRSQTVQCWGLWIPIYNYLCQKFI